jgi:hypothetical protein
LEILRLKREADQERLAAEEREARVATLRRLDSLTPGGGPTTLDPEDSDEDSAPSSSALFPFAPLSHLRACGSAKDQSRST